jgi:hypothetical protein
MASLFALGIMSVIWMAVVAGLVAFEKTVPWRRVASYGTADWPSSSTVPCASPLVDPEIPSDLGDRLARLPDDSDGPQLGVVFPSCL